MSYLNDLRTVDVLLVEDDDGDALMTREAFEFYKMREPLHVVTDGEQALAVPPPDRAVRQRPAARTDPARRQPPAPQRP